MLFGKRKKGATFTEAAPDMDSGGTSARREKKLSGAKMGRNFLIVILLLAVGYCLMGSVYSLKESEYAVITTFGVPAVVDEPGIHIKAPVVQQLDRVPKTINGFSIGYDRETNESIDEIGRAHV